MLIPLDTNNPAAIRVSLANWIADTIAKFKDNKLPEEGTIDVLFIDSNELESAIEDVMGRLTIDDYTNEVNRVFTNIISKALNKEVLRDKINDNIKADKNSAGNKTVEILKCASRSALWEHIPVLVIQEAIDAANAVKAAIVAREAHLFTVTPEYSHSQTEFNTRSNNGDNKSEANHQDDSGHGSETPSSEGSAAEWGDTDGDVKRDQSSSHNNTFQPQAESDSTVLVLPTLRGKIIQLIMDTIGIMKNENEGVQLDIDHSALFKAINNDRDIANSPIIDNNKEAQRAFSRVIINAMKSINDLDFKDRVNSMHDKTIEEAICQVVTDIITDQVIRKAKDASEAAIAAKKAHTPTSATDSFQFQPNLETKAEFSPQSTNVMNKGAAVSVNPSLATTNSPYSACRNAQRFAQNAKDSANVARNLSNESKRSAEEAARSVRLGKNILKQNPRQPQLNYKLYAGITLSLLGAGLGGLVALAHFNKLPTALNNQAPRFELLAAVFITLAVVFFAERISTCLTESTVTAASLNKVQGKVINV